MSTVSEQAALLLDELMCRNDLGPLFEPLQAMLPPGHADQVEAAIARIRAVGSIDVLPADMPDWLRLCLFSAVTGWVNGEARTCLHDPDPMRPEPTVAVAWKPGYVTCAPCSPSLMPKAGSAADRTCDRCGTVVEGVIGKDPVYTTFIAFGPFMLAFGVCTDCFKDLPAQFHEADGTS